MTVNRSLLLVVISALCFAIATLSGVNVIHTDAVAWAYGGALAYVLSVIA